MAFRSRRGSGWHCSRSLELAAVQYAVEVAVLIGDLADVLHAVRVAVVRRFAAVEHAVGVAVHPDNLADVLNAVAVAVDRRFAVVGNVVDVAVVARQDTDIKDTVLVAVLDGLALVRYPVGVAISRAPAISTPSAVPSASQSPGNGRAVATVMRLSVASTSEGAENGVPDAP